MRQRRVSLDVLDFSLLIIDQYPNNNMECMQGIVIAKKLSLCDTEPNIYWPFYIERQCIFIGVLSNTNTVILYIHITVEVDAGSTLQVRGPITIIELILQEKQ
jgi:hypothetical protein